MLRMHQNYGPIPFNRLQYMATNGVLPKHLVACTFSISTACLYGKTTKLPRKTNTASFDDRVCVNVVVSSTSDLIAQMSGFITRSRYYYALVFVDHHYDFTYVNIIKSKTEDAAVEANE